MFRNIPIRFKVRQARYITQCDPSRRLELLSETVMANSQALLEAVHACHDLNIGSFRINSRFFPLITHPDVGYAVHDLPDWKAILHTLGEVKQFCAQQDIRLTFHPDQFILLSSPNKEIVERSIADLLYHDHLAETVGADVINIHGGGGYGDKKAALNRLMREVASLPASVQRRLTLENDDRVYTPEDLLPVCRSLGIPFVYDVHHHRCLPDTLSLQEATTQAMLTWDREPLFHLSSPKDGWVASNPRPHHDMINPEDFPRFWQDLQVTVDIEAKAKEVAIARLVQDLEKMVQ